jgi:hypothetical protein
MNNKKILKIKHKLTKKNKVVKTKVVKKKQIKTKLRVSLNKHNKTLNNKASNNKIIIDKINKAEINILINTIKNEIIFLLSINNSKKNIKTKIIKLLKEIRKNNKLINKNTTDKELIVFFNTIYEQSKIIYETKLNKNTIINKGGYYFKNIEDKGDKPVTGNDMAILLDEMQEFFSSAQYTDEGAFIKAPNTLLGLFRGDTDAFKNYIIWQILPQYITMIPPFIKWDAIGKIFKDKKYEDIPDYLLAYQSYMRSKDEYLVEKGLKSPDVLKKDLYTGFYDKLANSMDQNIMKFQKYRNLGQGKAPLGMLPL